jgi:aquaporin Z
MKLSSNQKRFFAELVGTFVVVVLATGSVVINAQHGGKIGLWFEAFAPFVAVSLMVYAFGKISMAHFNPAVTVTFLITKHMPKNQLLIYLSAEFIGAFLASLFVKFVIGTDANLGANAPNYFYPLPIIFAVEVFATVLLLAVILAVVHTKGLYGGSGLAIGGIVGLDILFLSFISGASMNPIRALAPAILSGFLNDLWLYWSATFVGAVIVAGIYRKKFAKTI